MVPVSEEGTLPVAGALLGEASRRGRRKAVGQASPLCQRTTTARSRTWAAVRAARKHICARRRPPVRDPRSTAAGHVAGARKAGYAEINLPADVVAAAECRLGG